MTPKVLSAVRGDNTLSAYPWYWGLGTLEHILFGCPFVKDVRQKIVTNNSKLFGSMC